MGRKKPVVWKQFSPRLMYGIARRVAPDAEHLWSDMVQEGWLRLISNKNQPHKNPQAFFRKVVANAMRDFLRKEHQSDRRILTFARAKHFRLLRCPSCRSADIVWTWWWPSLVRCKGCLDTFAVEDTST